jgi:hypothetical protein
MGTLKYWQKKQSMEGSLPTKDRTFEWLEHVPQVYCERLNNIDKNYHPARRQAGARRLGDACSTQPDDVGFKF